MDSKPPTTRPPRAVTQAMAPCEQLAAAYDQHAEGMYRYAVMILADPSGAEDAVQQVFARLAQMEKRISHVATLGGYLRTAVRNECFRAIRRRPPNTPGLDQAAILEAAEPEGLDADELQAIDRAMRRLPSDQREVVYLKVYEQMTFAQIAAVTNVSPNTVVSRYRYAMDKLRLILTPMVEEQRDARA